MNLRKYSAAFALLVLLLWAAPIEVKAGIVPPAWNIVGDFVFGYEVQDGNYSLYLDITSMDFDSGAFTAIIPPSGYTFFDGSVQGSDISFDWGDCALDTFGLLNCVVDNWTGTIAANGTISGGLEQSPGWSGFWYTESGNAEAVAPEPQSLVLALLGISLLGLGWLRAGRFASDPRNCRAIQDSNA